MTISDLLSPLFPNGEPVPHFGPDSFQFPWADYFLVITHDSGAEEDVPPYYVISFAPFDDTAYSVLGDAVLGVILPDDTALAAEYVDNLTDATPTPGEGHDFIAWAAQYTSDNYDNAQIFYP